MTSEHQYKIARLGVCEKRLREMRTWLYPINEKYNYNTDKELVEIISKIDQFLNYAANDIGNIRAELWLDWEEGEEQN